MRWQISIIRQRQTKDYTLPLLSSAENCDSSSSMPTRLLHDTQSSTSFNLSTLSPASCPYPITTRNPMHSPIHRVIIMRSTRKPSEPPTLASRRRGRVNAWSHPVPSVREHVTRFGQDGGSNVHEKYAGRRIGLWKMREGGRWYMHVWLDRGG